MKTLQTFLKEANEQQQTENILMNVLRKGGWHINQIRANSNGTIRSLDLRKNNSKSVYAVTADNLKIHFYITAKYKNDALPVFDKKYTYKGTIDSFLDVLLMVSKETTKLMKA